MTEYDAVLFDNDGVLVELTEMTVLRNAARRAFESVGLEDPPSSLVDHAAEENLDALEVLETTHDVSLETFWAEREKWAIRHQREAIRNDGKPLFEDVAALADLPHRMGVVSNNQHETVEFIVEHYGLVDRFEHVLGRDATLDGARRKKPDTHYLDRAVDELGVTDALYVGDSPKDVVCADEAGLDSAFLRRSHRDEASVETEPTYRIADLRELAALLRD